MPTTLEWLRRQDDDRLISLFAARPDLAVPAPSDFETLARRINTAPSVWRAMETVDQFHLEILTALTLLHAERHPVSVDDLVAFAGADITAEQFARALDTLTLLGLVWGDTHLRIPYPVIEALGPHPAGLGAEIGLAATTVVELLAGCSERELGVLHALAAGPPVGVTAAGGPITAVLTALVSRRLLMRREPTLVELPREVGLVLRGEHPLGPVHPQQPQPQQTSAGRATVDATGAAQALQVRRQLTAVIEALSASSVPALKSGGLGVRETRKLVKELGLEDWVLSLLLEILVTANLVAMTDQTSRSGAIWTPTVGADGWIGQSDESAWAFIVGHWLGMRRDPAKAGQPDLNGKPLNLLTPELSWLRGPSDRRWVLGALADLPPGDGWSPESAQAVLSWRSPLRSGDRRDRLVATVLREATTLGVIAFDAVTTAGRAALAGMDGVAEAVSAALPEPVRTVVLQADLTVVATGRLVPELAAELAVAADIESAGSATVYRVTPTSVRRALDQGRSAGDLHRLFGDHSLTPVPQALTYLIDDMARRHGSLRAGTTAAYLRCDDPLLIDQAISHAAKSGILLRRLAPTVAISSTEADELITELRRVGMVPVAEDEFGALVSLQKAPRRANLPLVASPRWREPTHPSREQLAVLVERMRSLRLPMGAGAQTPQETTSVLREAAGARSPVWIEYANAEGSPTRRLVEPIAVSGGSVAAFDRLSGQLKTFVLHRITAVEPSEQGS